MIYVTLAKGKIHLKPDDKTFEFNRSAWREIGEFLAKRPGWTFLCSSSCDFPEEEGFPKTFRVHEVMGKAVEHAYKILGVDVPVGPLSKAIDALEKAAKTYKNGFPLPLTLQRAGRKGEDVTLVFNSKDEFDTFTDGVRYAQRLVKRGGS